MAENFNIKTSSGVKKLLDASYQKAVQGIDYLSPSVELLAKDYLKPGVSPADAARKMINYQIAKCTTSGFVTGFGGFVTMPVTIPANISSVLYVQMRMIACTAYMAGFDINSDQVQTLVYACLAGVAVSEIVKNTGVKFGEKLTVSMIEKIPGAALVKINQTVGFRFMTKFGSKGLVNLGKIVPVVGAIVSGGLDLAETKLIGERAYKMFF